MVFFYLDPEPDPYWKKTWIRIRIKRLRIRNSVSNDGNFNVLLVKEKPNGVIFVPNQRVNRKMRQGMKSESKGASSKRVRHRKSATYLLYSQ